VYRNLIDISIKGKDEVLNCIKVSKEHPNDEQQLLVLEQSIAAQRANDNMQILYFIVEKLCHQISSANNRGTSELTHIQTTRY
jgi:hypothetical protein